MERRRQWSRDLGTEAPHDSEFPGFPFGLICLTLGTGKSGNSETPMGTDKKKKKKPQQKPTLSSKRARKEQPSKDGKLVDNS